MGKPIKTPAQQLAKWQAGGSAANANTWATNASGTTANVGQLAAAAVNKAGQNYNAVINSEAHQAKLTRPQFMADYRAGVSSTSAKQKWSSGFSNGSRGATRYNRFATAFAPVYAQMRQAANAAGDDAVARFSAAYEVIRNAGRKGGNPVNW